MMRYWTISVLLLLGACGTDADKAKPSDGGADDGGNAGAPVYDDLFIRDAQGRALVLRGANVAHTAKRSPNGVPWVDREAVLRLRQDFGLNVIRLTLFWDFVEPERGKYDEVYLGKIREILDWAEAGDIHVVLDMHQDLFGFEATDLNEGDGVPDWAHKTSCPAFENLTPWHSNYNGAALQCQFSAFWANEEGIQDTLANTWKHIAGKLGDHPAVIGADLFNEPWIPNSVEVPADALTPFYARLIPKLREGAKDMRVFYEPGTLSGSILDQPVPKPKFVNMVYAPHFYPAYVFFATTAYATDAATLDELHARHKANAKQAKVALWIGEFGAAASVPKIAQYYLDLNERWGPDFVGYARWSYDSTKNYDLSMLGDKGEEPDHLTSMLEPYAERIPGTPKRTKVDMQKRVLELDFDAERGGELVVSCPKRFCATTRTVSLSAAGKVIDQATTAYDAQLGQLRVTLPKAKGLAFTLSWGG